MWIMTCVPFKFAHIAEFKLNTGCGVLNGSAV